MYRDVFLCSSMNCNFKIFRKKNLWVSDKLNQLDVYICSVKKSELNFGRFLNPPKISIKENSYSEELFV